MASDKVGCGPSPWAAPTQDCPVWHSRELPVRWTHTLRGHGCADRARPPSAAGWKCAQWFWTRHSAVLDCRDRSSFRKSPSPVCSSETHSTFSSLTRTDTWESLSAVSTRPAVILGPSAGCREAYQSACDEGGKGSLSHAFSYNLKWILWRKKKKRMPKNESVKMSSVCHGRNVVIHPPLMDVLRQWRQGPQRSGKAFCLISVAPALCSLSPPAPPRVFHALPIYPQINAEQWGPTNPPMSQNHRIPY